MSMFKFDASVTAYSVLNDLAPWQDFFLYENKRVQCGW
jgi:hypothetical protein